MGAPEGAGRSEHSGRSHKPRLLGANSEASPRSRGSVTFPRKRNPRTSRPRPERKPGRSRREKAPGAPWTLRSVRRSRGTRKLVPSRPRTGGHPSVRAGDGDARPWGPRGTSPLCPAPQRSPRATPVCAFLGEGNRPRVGGEYLSLCLTSPRPGGPRGSRASRTRDEAATSEGWPAAPAMAPSPSRGAEAVPSPVPASPPLQARREDPHGRPRVEVWVQLHFFGRVSTRSGNTDRVCTRVRARAGAHGGTDLDGGDRPFLCGSPAAP